MNRTLQRGKVALALLVLFASGIGLGWFGRELGKAPAQLAAAAESPPAAAANWTKRAMATLSRELHLTAEQEQQIRPLLRQTAVSLDLDRERALFQLHLQVLRVHDAMRPHLRPDQLPALEQMRLRLQQDIKRRFAAILNDPSQPTPDI